MRNVISSDPFSMVGEPGTVAAGGEVGACCGVVSQGRTLPCFERGSVTCLALGGMWKAGSCDLLDQLGHLDSEGRCFFRHCDRNVCVESNAIPFPCESLYECTLTIIGKCRTATEEPCADELGACCKVHLGGGCEELYARVRCEIEFGIFMGEQTSCGGITCPADDAPEGCREYNERTVPAGLRRWSSDVCSGVAMEVLLDGFRNAAVMSDRMRLFGIPVRSTEDPCLQCQTAISFGMNGDANAPFVGNAQNNDPLYHEHYKAWMVLDEHGLYGNKNDAILVGAYRTPPWAEFLFMSHGTFCGAPLE